MKRLRSISLFERLDRRIIYSDSFINTGISVFKTQPYTLNNSSRMKPFRPIYAWLSSSGPSQEYSIIEPMDKRLLFQYLQLQRYTKNEINDIYDQVLAKSTQTEISATEDGHENYSRYADINDVNNGSINHQMMSAFLADRIQNIDLKQKEKLLQEFETKDYSCNKISNDKAVNYNEMKQYAEMESKRAIQLLLDGNANSFSSNCSMLTRNDFCNKIEALATELDVSRTVPISVSMLLVGSSVGIIIPVMPYVVQNLGITAGEYGVVVGSFALAKLFANVPAAVMVEKHGRKPFLVYSLVLVGLGVGGIAICTEWYHVGMCRTLTGVGVSLLSTAATLSIADCSTPLNRARTMAPMMSAFAAGTALGPALGGVLADNIGINNTFLAVGAFYFGLSAINKLAITETQFSSELDRIFPWNEWMKAQKQKVLIPQDRYLDSFQNAVSQWSSIWKNPKVRNVVVMNGFYWFSLSGAQMTLLPLILTDQTGLAMTATQVGNIYMGMSLVQVLANPSIGYVVDKMGKAPGIIGGCGLLSVSMFALPFCTEFNQVASTLVFWALGSTVLGFTPTSYISDNVIDNKRAQALALLRTSGDIGFLFGAATMGNAADVMGMDVAVHTSSTILLAATSWFGIRRWLDHQSMKQANK